MSKTFSQFSASTWTFIIIIISVLFSRFLLIHVRLSYFSSQEILDFLLLRNGFLKHLFDVFSANGSRYALMFASRAYEDDNIQAHGAFWFSWNLFHLMSRISSLRKSTMRRWWWLKVVMCFWSVDDDDNVKIKVVSRKIAINFPSHRCAWMKWNKQYPSRILFYFFPARMCVCCTHQSQTTNIKAKLNSKWNPLISSENEPWKKGARGTNDFALVWGDRTRETIFFTISEHEAVDGSNEQQTKRTQGEEKQN